ncbi:unnamed protein product [Eruca vesicaria subsp. sativa]|uniref:Uncharacterized protein n=1 Tax=Eruca vesicaria subsp. sativa TaxID=29727 RepID=A0ABC8JYW0_ERUVS|nr:unnamed protein product [Eruca vesicaria subsp. sativa]
MMEIDGETREMDKKEAASKGCVADAGFIGVNSKTRRSDAASDAAFGRGVRRGVRTRRQTRRSDAASDAATSPPAIFDVASSLLMIDEILLPANIV